jgi:hypothetical protein
MATHEVRCGSCSTLNRVQGYSVRRIPQCGKCHAKLPESNATRALRQLYVSRFPIAVIVVSAILVWLYWDIVPKSATSTAARPEPQVPACTVSISPREGIYQWYGPEWGDDIASFTIKTAVGSNYFVKLEDLSGRTVRTFFVNGGSSFSSRVPLGTFVLKYASGQSWCNEHDLFGPDTSTAKANDTFAFEQNFTGDGYTVSAWTVELILQRGGNLRTHSIPRSQF